MISKERLIVCCLYPVKAIGSKKFYFEVLFKLKGFGIVYLLLLSLLLSLPASIRISGVIETFKSIELPRLIASIPPSYLSENGELTPKNPDETYKELTTQDGILAIIYNVNDIDLKDSSVRPIVELNSRTLTVHTSTQNSVVSYVDLFVPGSDFNPVETSGLVDMVFNVAKTVLYVFISGWFFCILAFNSLIIAFISKAFFLFFGKMKTGFSNILRLSSFANTIVGVVLVVEFFVSVKISFTLVMLLPLIYMFLFIRDFRSELLSRGVEDFVKEYTPEGTKIRNYQTNEAGSGKDLSEYTQGLDSTSNRAHPDEQNGVGKDSEDTDTAKDKNSNGGSGYFAP
ncbi:MAG: DUF1189 family protein [Succinivibrio sp.]